MNLRPILVAAGVAHIAVGLWMAVDPGGFHDSVATYGLSNDHLFRDLATLSLALGVGLLVAADRPSWRVPVLGLAALQYGLHTINHIRDIAEPPDLWLGIANAVVIAAGTVLFAWLAVIAARQEAGS
jgi:hypothetical protein